MAPEVAERWGVRVHPDRGYLDKTEKRGDATTLPLQLRQRFYFRVNSPTCRPA